MKPARELLATFDLEHLPNLDVAVVAALELFAETSVSALAIPFKNPLVMGSGNGLVAAQIITANMSAQYANESNYTQVLKANTGFDGMVIVSASGSKHAIAMVGAAKVVGLPVLLITNTQGSAAAAGLSSDMVRVYPKNREPYTYNTSTYLGPILAATDEDSEQIRVWLENEVSAKLLRNFADYGAVTFILPKEYVLVTEMIKTKFDELFGPMLTGRAFSEEEIKHAKTVVTSGDELFISLGVTNEYYGLLKNRLYIPLPSVADFASVIAASYYIIGKIQAAHPPYFKQNIERYCQTASQVFKSDIRPIAE